MDEENRKKLGSSFNANRIESLDRNWSEYRTRATLVLKEFEGIIGKPIIGAIEKSGYSKAVNNINDQEGDATKGDDTLAYIYNRLAYRAAQKVEESNGLVYYAITGDPKKIKEDIEIEDPAIFWVESLSQIKQNFTKEDVKQIFDDMLKSYSLMEEMRMIDFFAIKAIRDILDLPPLVEKK
jgi:hypothetical protein